MAKKRKKPLTSLVLVCVKICRKFRVKRKGKR